MLTIFKTFTMPRRGKRDAQEDGDKDYKSMAPCYYVDKTDEVKKCA